MHEIAIQTEKFRAFDKNLQTEKLHCYDSCIQTDPYMSEATVLNNAYRQIEVYERELASHQTRFASLTELKN